MRGWGRYDLELLFPDLDEVNPTSFVIQSTGSSLVQENTDAADSQPLTFIPRQLWNETLETGHGAGSTPRVVAVAPDGQYEFYPRLDKQYVLRFNYSASPVALVDHDDVHDLPEHYEDVILWATVKKWARYDKQSAAYQYAHEQYRFWKNQLDVNKKPKYAFGRNKFYG